MPKEVLVEIIKIIPNVLGLFILIGVLRAFYKPIVKRLVPRVKEFKAFGIEANFFQKELERATQLRDKRIDEESKDALLRRIARMPVDFSEYQLLWIDDQPEKSIHDRNLLVSIGFGVEVVKTSKEAQEVINKGKIDIIISDIDRGEGEKEGLAFLDRIRKEGVSTPLMFYIQNFDPAGGVPPYCSGITADPKEMIHLVLDIMERII